MLISLSRWSAAGCLGGPPLPRRFGRGWSRDLYGALWIPSAFGQQAGVSRVELVRLARDDAKELHQTEGEPFLATRRISRDASGSIVEYVTSLLHPAHFTLRLNFGPPRR